MIFSQTQRTRTSTNYDERQVIVSTRTISGTWCLSTLAILKWLEIVCCIIIIAVLQPYVYCWSAYSYIIFVAVSCLITTIVTLLIYFLQLHNGALKSLPWRAIEMSFNILALILFLFAFAIGVYDCVIMFEQRSFAHHNVHYRDSTFDELKPRMAVVTAFLGANCIFYLLSALYASRGTTVCWVLFYASFANYSLRIYGAALYITQALPR